MHSTYIITLDVADNLTRGYLFYSSILVGKTLAMSVYTAIKRFQKKVRISPEDLIIKDGTMGPDEDVERVRRAHQNDLENIPMFLFSGFVYLLTEPDPTVAINLFRVYTASRLIHTFVYSVYVVPQPARAIAFFAGYGITWFMLVKAIITFFPNAK